MATKGILYSWLRGSFLGVPFPLLDRHYLPHCTLPEGSWLVLAHLASNIHLYFHVAPNVSSKSLVGQSQRV